SGEGAIPLSQKNLEHFRDRPAPWAGAATFSFLGLGGFDIIIVPDQQGLSTEAIYERRTDSPGDCRRVGDSPRPGSGECPTPSRRKHDSLHRPIPERTDRGAGRRAAPGHRGTVPLSAAFAAAERGSHPSDRGTGETDGGIEEQDRAGRQTAGSGRPVPPLQTEAKDAGIRRPGEGVGPPGRVDDEIPGRGGGGGGRPSLHQRGEGGDLAGGGLGRSTGYRGGNRRRRPGHPSVRAGVYLEKGRPRIQRPGSGEENGV